MRTIRLWWIIQLLVSVFLVSLPSVSFEGFLSHIYIGWLSRLCFLFWLHFHPWFLLDRMAHFFPAGIYWWIFFHWQWQPDFTFKCVKFESLEAVAARGMSLSAARHMGHHQRLQSRNTSHVGTSHNDICSPVGCPGCNVTRIHHGRSPREHIIGPRLCFFLLFFSDPAPKGFKLNRSLFWC